MTTPTPNGRTSPLHSRIYRGVVHHRRREPRQHVFRQKLYMLYLEPELVGGGLGTTLLRRAFDELGRCRCHWVVVWVLAKNQRARQFYERAGMQLDGARRWDPFGERSVTQALAVTSPRRDVTFSISPSAIPKLSASAALISTSSSGETISMPFEWCVRWPVW